MIIVKQTKNKNSEEATKWIEPIEGLELKIASINNPKFKAANSLLTRHLSKLDQMLKVGTPDFDISKIEDAYSQDDAYIGICASHLLLDWKGVGELVNGKEVAIEYTPEKGAEFLKQNPEFYWEILTAASNLAVSEHEQKEEVKAK